MRASSTAVWIWAEVHWKSVPTCSHWSLDSKELKRWCFDRVCFRRKTRWPGVHVLPGGQVKLTDFGIARLSDESALTADGQIFGTPSYMSPEQIEGRGLDHRSDLFSLGATLVELFTGRSLFANVDEVLRPFTVPPLHLGERACPRVVSELVTELLAVDPAARPQDAAAVADRLEQGLHDLTHQPVRTELAPGAEIRQTYELVARLGRGATATTWKARQLQTDHFVVLKIE